MRRVFVAACVLVVGVLLTAGCGSGTVMNTAPMSEEQKQKVKSEDEKIADEESGGTAGKVKPKKGK